MALNYEEICQDNQRRYGTDIGRIGQMLLADRYGDQTHFIFELLQNAEDALRRRGNNIGKQYVTFTLKADCLTFSHFGQPFDENDVRGVCGIAESTKDKSSIGRFGIGFKSMYTFTDCPEIHSGDEDFAIKDYVLPKSVPPVTRDPDETQIILPFKENDPTAVQAITSGLKQLKPSDLLFLQYIDEIRWSVQGVSGSYQRTTIKTLEQNARHVRMTKSQNEHTETEEDWLVFHRPVYSDDQEKAGKVELAFPIQKDKDQSGHWSVSRLPASPLVVFFSTIIETHLGFLIQGPYKTTPSRDNIIRDDRWNKHLVKQTAELLIDAMRWLRDNEMLGVSALHCLPLNREKFSDESMFAPLFSAVKKEFLKEPFLPQFGGGYVSADHARLSRTQELRELFDPQQLAQLLGVEKTAWLSGDITQDRTPEIRRYIMNELNVKEETPESIITITHLTKTFLEAQPDEWIMRLYEFLEGQPRLKQGLNELPLVRLKNGRHVQARIDEKLQAFFPTNNETGFPTVKPAVFASKKARSFLQRD